MWLNRIQWSFWQYAIYNLICFPPRKQSSQLLEKSYVYTSIIIFSSSQNRNLHVTVAMINNMCSTVSGFRISPHSGYLSQVRPLQYQLELKVSQPTGGQGNFLESVVFQIFIKNKFPEPVLPQVIAPCVIQLPLNCLKYIPFLRLTKILQNERVS